MNLPPPVSDVNPLLHLISIKVHVKNSGNFALYLLFVYSDSTVIIDVNQLININEYLATFDLLNPKSNKFILVL